MSVLDLVQISQEELGNKNLALLNPSQEVTDFGSTFQAQVDNLIETFNAHKIAVGLAAPQVGINLRFAVINITKDKVGETLVIVNPKILSTSGKKDRKNESCMSLPHLCGEVERREKMSVSYQDRFGAPQTIEAQGFLARVFAHEIDHLDGMLYPTRMSETAQLGPTDIFKYD